MIRTLRRHPRRWAVPLSAVAFLGAVELGCVHLFGSGFVLGTNVCEKSGERMARLSSSAVLPAPPAGAAAVEGHPEAGGECVDDRSGDPWITVGRVYRFDGDREALADHYRQSAAKAGWTPGDPGSAPEGDGTAGLCFDRDVSGEPALLRLSFDSSKAYLVSVESSLDGTPMDC